MASLKQVVCAASSSRIVGGVIGLLMLVSAQLAPAQITLHTVTPNSIMQNSFPAIVTVCCSGLVIPQATFMVHVEWFHATGPWIANGLQASPIVEISPGYQQFSVNVPQAVMALPTGSNLLVKVISYSPTYMTSNTRPILISSNTTSAPQISGFQPPMITPSQIPITLIVFGSNFKAWNQLFLNMTPVPTTFVNSGWIQATLSPTLPMFMVPGGVTVNVIDPFYPHLSNTMVLPVLTQASNLGHIGFVGVAPIPGFPPTLNIESVAASSHFILVASAPPASPLFPWPHATMPMILGIDLPTMFTVVDLLATPYPSVQHPLAVGPGYRFTMPITVPSPPLGLDFALQAAWIDPASPVGYRLTYPIQPLAF